MDKDTILEQLCDKYPLLSAVKSQIENISNAIIECYEGGGKLLICGNGGSCSDAEHIVGELMKSFEVSRPLENDLRKKMSEISPARGAYMAGKLQRGLPAIALTAHTSLATAICNDIDPDLLFAQQVVSYGKAGDLLLAISTSGNSRNVTDACIAARALNMTTTGLTGKKGGEMKEFCDILICVPEEITASVQELHLPVLHVICRIVENHFFKT